MILVLSIFIYLFILSLLLYYAALRYDVMTLIVRTWWSADQPGRQTGWVSGTRCPLPWKRGKIHDTSLLNMCHIDL